jgi:hypothetical protein
VRTFSECTLRAAEPGVVAGAGVGQRGGDRAQAFDEGIEGARIHVPSIAGTRAKVQVSIVSRKLTMV